MSTTVVEHYCTSDIPISIILQGVAEPRTPIITSLLQLHECLDGRRLAKDALKTAEAVAIQGADQDLIILMLSAWAELSCRIGRPSAAVALIQRALSLVSENTRPEVHAAVKLVESLIADTTGNKRKCESILREILAVLPQHSPRRRQYIWELALLMGRQGRGVDAQSEMRELAWQGSDRFKLSRLLLLQFVNAMETCRIQQAGQLLTQLHANPLNPRDLLRTSYNAYQALLSLLQAVRQNKTIPAEQAAGWPAWVQVIRFLLARNMDEALRLAREDAGRQLHPIFGIGFESYNLIRAELSAGKWEGAARLLKMRQARGNYHYLDDIFLARAERLAGNQRNASHHFAQALRSAEYSMARGRLDFELALSCELSQGDVVQLAQAAEKTLRRAGATASAKGGAVPPGRSAAAPQPVGSDAGRPGTGARIETDAAAEAVTSAGDSGQRALAAIRGRSAEIAAVRDMAERFANLDAPVLITGETGTGKELVARALHHLSSRSQEPFTAINCSSITETLLESELFGHARGAFTGAEKAGKGMFEATGKGTIFLDEIGDISPRLQAALLRVLESGEMRAVGSPTPRTIACRVVAATNIDLSRKAQEGGFRQDLVFRLQRLTLHVPPLRERREDILVLTRYFLDMGRRVGVHATFSPALSQALRDYDWPGNVRELRNVIERMRLMHSDKLHYDFEDLDLKFQGTGGATRETPGTGEATLPAGAQRSGAVMPLQEPARETVAPRLGPFYPHQAQPSIEDVLLQGKTRLRRLDRLRALFVQHRKLTRAEIMHILGSSPNTATKDLQILLAENFIQRVTPSASTRSHYFAITVASEDGMPSASNTATEPPPVRGGR